MGIWRAALLLPLAACGEGDLEYRGTLGAENPAKIALGTPMLAATVNADMTGRFLIDTGAPFTILDTDSFSFDDGKHRIELDAFMVTFLDYDVVAYDALPFTMGEIVREALLSSCPEPKTKTPSGSAASMGRFFERPKSVAKWIIVRSQNVSPVFWS